MKPAADAPGSRRAGGGDPSDADTPDLGVPGLTALDHTADVGLEIRAPELPELFCRAARGLLVLLLDRPAHPNGLDDGAADVRTVSLAAEDLPRLLRQWLREVLFWFEDTGWAVADCRVRSVTRTELEVTVRGAPETSEPIREIKGVTLHGLEVERVDEGWTARVIFDV